MTNYTLAERAEIVKKITAVEKVPYQSKCPKVKIYWRGKNKKDGEYTKIYYPITGEIVTEDTNNYKRTRTWGSAYYKSIDNEDYNYAVSSARSEVVSYYANYYEDYECLEIALIIMPANRGKEGEKRTWEFWDHVYMAPRLFMFKGIPEVFTADGLLYYQNEMGMYYNKQVVRVLTSYGQMGQHNKKFSEEIQKFSANYVIERYYCSNAIEYPWGLAEYYKHMIPRNVSKLKKKVDELNVEDITDFVNKHYPIRLVYKDPQYHWRNRYQNTRVVVFEKLSDNEGMFRYFVGGTDDGCPHEEKYRIIINNKGVPTFLEKNGLNGWRISSAKVGNRIYEDKELVKVNWDKMNELNHLKYISQMMKEVVADAKADGKTRNEIQLMIDILRHPIIEKLWKAGYHNLAKAVQEDGNIAANLRDIFSAKDKKTGTITEVLGLNRYQLQKLDTIASNKEESRDSYYRNRFKYRLDNVIPTVKLLTRTNNISSLSNESTDKYFTAAKELNKADRGWRTRMLCRVDEDGNITNRHYYWYNKEENQKPLTEEEQKHINNIIRIGNKDNRAYKIFSDMVGTFCNLNNEYRPQIDIYAVESLDELMRVHDQLNDLYTVQRAEDGRLREMAENERNKILEKKMDKIQEKRIEKYEEIGEEFSIIVPRHLAQLVTEGTVQSICIGSYCERYAKGDTDLVFIRRTKTADLPFYAMEINNGCCVQIHGRRNCHLGNNPEAIPFVKQWLDKRNISYRREQLLETATGYCSSGKLLDGTPYGL